MTPQVSILDLTGTRLLQNFCLKGTSEFTLDSIKSDSEKESGREREREREREEQWRELHGDIDFDRKQV